MDAQTTGPYSHSIISAGVDWLTATRKHGEGALPFLEAGNALLDEVRAAGGDIKPAALRDYVGHRGQGCFYGARPTDSIIVISGQRAPAHFAKVAQAASNVSRLDLQVSVWTHGEQPNIAREQYARLTKLPPARGRPRNYSLIQSHPTGETLYVGKRSSDYYGRVYDWSAAHKAGVPLTIWRFEIEIKRLPARAHSHALACDLDHSISVADYVFDWFVDRGLQVTWSKEDSEVKLQRPIAEKHRDTLAWIETNMSKTVARMIKQHGLQKVVFALGLGDMVRPFTEEEKRNACQSTWALPSKPVRRDSRTDDTERLSLSDAL